MSEGLKTLRVLIVDDEPDMLEVLKARFEIFGLNVLTASSGNEGLSVVQKEHVDIIISDVRMANGSGVDLLTQIRKKHHEKPIVLFITGHSDISIEEAYAQGADGVFPKPFDSKNLLEAVRKALKSKDVLWSRPLTLSDDQKFQKKFQSIEEATKKGLLKIGRGGFSIGNTDLLAPVDSAVDFRIEFDEGPIKSIEGSGYVRWRRSSKENPSKIVCGIEIQYLTDNTRRAVVDYIKDLKTKSYIPS